MKNDGHKPEQDEPPGPTVLAQRVRRVKTAVLKVVKEREKVPKSLFWSLFHSEINSIREAKEKKSKARALWLSGADDEL
jgi:hypothetical protein